MSVLLWLLNNPLVSAALAAFFAFIFGTMKGRLDGGARERAKRAAEELKARDMADEIEDAIAGRSPDENRERLKRW